jgi:endogenous inhibitor of DNA gyrase (YacG/DUF329 family)
MEINSSKPMDNLVTACVRCGASIARNPIPAEFANLFCSRRCEKKANFWLLQEMCEIEINYLPWPSEK